MTRRLLTGTEYERLLPSLRLETPWATGTGPVPSPASAPPPSRPEPTVVASAGGPERRARTAAAVARDRRADVPDAEPVWTVIDRHAESTPDNIALSCGSREVSYGRLRARTNRFAALLRSQGVRPGDVVPLALGRGIDMIEAMISVWKAGAAFLPMDPAAPASWRRETAESAGAKVHVTAGATVTLPGATRIDIESVDLESGPDEPIPAADTGVAYVIRTSGSTGAPKLVAVGHRGVSNLLDVIRREIPWLTSDATALQFSSPYFDGVVFDLLMGLGAGARLAVHEGLADDLAGAIRAAGVTHVALPAAVVRQLDPAAVPTLRVLLSVGDVCLTETARIWAPRLRFVNGYGPTEATVCATLHTVEPRDLPAGATVPIGRPVPGVHVVLTDDNLDPVPEGATGEICVGGLGVATGYVGRPAEFERRFPHDPYDPGARLYRTGDLGRLLPDGSLEFLGRRDDEVKVRGFRVEPAEVERALSGLPAVAEAVVLFAPSVEGGTLAGYVRAADNAALDGKSVVKELEQTLPAHLLPSAVVVVDRWPLTDNGKIDRARLPRPGAVTGAEHVAPRTPVENIVAAIAARLLGLDQVGVNDVFFDLGGHSLLATQLVAQVKTVLDKDLELSAVMTGATIGEIAATVQSLTTNATTVPAPAPPGADLVPSSMQQRVWLTHNIEPESVAYNAQGVLRLHGDLDLAALRASLSSYVRRYDVLRSRFPFRDGELRFELDEPWEVDLPVIDLSGVPSDERDRLLGAAIRAHVRTRFELAEGRLIRWILLRTAEDEHLLAHVEHHAVHDGWSFNVYLNELLKGYNDHLDHGEVRRPVPSIQFHDYAVWQRQWLRTAEADRQRDFWRRELAGANTILPLPARSRSVRRRFEGADPRFDISGDLARRLDQFSRDNGVTLYMTMLAAYFVVLHRYSRAEDILVGSGFANRGFDGAENMVGMFINTVVVRGRLAGDPPFTELLGRVRRTCLAAHDNQDLPFEEVLGDLDIERVPGVNPLLQSMFTFHDVPHLHLDRMPLDVTAIEGMTNGTAKFDLNVIAVPRYATPGHITCEAGNVVHIPRSDGPVTPSPRRELDGVTLSWEYDSALFDQAMMCGMLDAYVTVLETILGEPDTLLSEFSLLSEENVAHLRALGVAADPGPAVAAALPALIDRWITQNPERIAVECDGIRLSYGELGTRAGRLAGRLAAEGVRAGQVVAVNVARSADAVVAMLAVLKAGAAFVVLDPRGVDPVSVFTDSGAQVTIVTPATRDMVPPGFPVVSTVDVTAPDASDIPPGGPEDVAFWHYREGRDGTPTGMAVTHAEIVSALPVPDESVVVSGVGADASIVLSGLAHGASMILASPGEIPAVLAARPVTQAFLDFDSFRAVTALDTTLRRVVLTGPVLEPGLLAGIVPEIVGTYGLPETGVFRTSHASESSDAADITRPLPVGAPVPHARLSVVDEHSRLAPFGMLGRLCVEGLAGPALVTDDLAQWTVDGELELYGGPDTAVPVEPTSLKPVDDVEAMVTRLVCEVLVRDDVAPDEDFFELGGDSLLAMRLLARVHAVGQVRISLGEMLVDPTVEHLSRLIVAAGFTPVPTAIPRQPRAEVATRRADASDSDTRSSTPDAATDPTNRYGLSADLVALQREFGRFLRETANVTTPEEIRRRAGAAGFLAPRFSAADGGRGIGVLGTALLVEQAAATGSALARSAVGPPAPTVPAPELAAMSPILRARYLPGLIRGETALCVAISEGTGGSDLSTLATRAVRTGDGWMLSGEKVYISHADDAHLALTIARTADTGAVHADLTAFLVPRAEYSIADRQSMTGDMTTYTVRFDEARVPAGHVVSTVGNGLAVALSVLDENRIHIAAQALGLAQWCFDQAMAYVKGRQAYGRPLGDLQGVSFGLVDCDLALESVRVLTYETARRADRDGAVSTRDCSQLKLMATEQAFTVVDRCVQLMGARGLDRESGVESALRYLRMLRVVEGSSELQRSVLGQLMGLGVTNGAVSNGAVSNGEGEADRGRSSRSR